MSVPTVGVVLATHNGERYLPDQLESILGGTVKPHHVVLSDDDSTDGTVEVARRMLGASEVPYDVIINRPALGVARNVAAAVARSSSDVVVLSDQDDRWHADRLAEVARRFADPDVALLHGDARIIDAEGRGDGTTLFGRLEVTPQEIADITRGRAFDVFLRRNVATGATMAFRRAVVADALDVPRPWIHDEWFAIIAAARGRVVVATRPLLDYRLHGANQIGAEAPSLRRKIRRVMERDDGRLNRVAERSAALVAFLTTAGIPSPYLEAARAKAAFDAARSTLPTLRLARASRIVRWLMAGQYARFASRGRLDAVRDLLQPR